jgi:transcription antitermination factor NusG
LKRNRRRYRKAKLYKTVKHTPAHYVRLKLPKVEITPDRRWYVVRTMAHQDRRVAEQLEERGAVTYRPVLVEERVKRGKRVELPKYPAAGYVFAGLQEAVQGVERLFGCQGAVEVLSGQGGPLEVPSVDLQVFADRMTLANEDAREAMAIIHKPQRVRGLAELKRIVYQPFLG